MLPADLIEPKGELTVSLFPGEDASALTARVAAYLAEATTRVEDAAVPEAVVDDATRAWVYHRAYGAVYRAMSRSAATIQINDQGSRSILVTQIANFKTLADEALARYTALVPVVTDDATDTTRGYQPSRGVHNVIAW